jgi:hypothetical protein
MFRKSPALSPPGALGDFHDKPDRRQVKQSEGQPVQRLDAGEQPDGCRERGDGPAQNTGGGKRHRPAQTNPTQQPSPISKNTTTLANTDSDQSALTVKKSIPALLPRIYCSA